MAKPSRGIGTAGPNSKDIKKAKSKVKSKR